MFKKTFLLVVALLGLQTFLVSPVSAQKRDCKFSSPIEGGKTNGYFAFQAITPWEPSHTGEDFVYPVGTHVLAVDDGEVVFVGWWPPEGESSPYGYGPSVFIKHDCGVLSFYTHLDPSIPAVRTQKVERGQMIGLIGPKGIAPASNVPHLHFGVHSVGEPTLGYLMGGNWYDPKVFLNYTYVATKTPLGGMRTSEALSTPITLPSFDEIWENIAVLIPYGLGIIVLIILIKNIGHLASRFVYHVFWGTYKWNAWIFGATLAVPFSCIIFVLYPLLSGLPVAQQNALAAMSIEEKGTQYAAIYGRYRGWGTVGTLASAEAIVRKAEENAKLVSRWNKAPVKPVVILNIYGAGTKPESSEFIKQVLTAAKLKKAVVMLDIQPTPGQSFQELCATAVSYVDDDQIWISIDPEYFKGQFEASWLNQCAEMYNSALRSGRGVVGLWEFRPGGAWLLKDPQNVTRRRSRSMVLPMFDGFGSLQAKTAGLEQLKTSYGEPFGVAEWQSLYRNKYDKGFEPQELLKKGPWLVVRY